MNNQSMGEEPTEFQPEGSQENSALQPGDVLGDYTIRELLGRGGMGEVYRAENRVTGREVALKVISELASRGADFVERFKLEARVMSELELPGIVRVHHAGESQGRFYLTMDLVEGGTLEEWEGSRRTEAGGQGKNNSDETWVREIAVQLCEALSYAHGRGIVHRDLKPGNIMLDKEGRVKVTDFGLAKAVGDEFVSQLVKRSISLSMGKSIGDLPTELGSSKRAAYEGTSTGAILGTYEYMSPEQQVGGEVTQQSDLYSLGVILYWLLTGRKPKGRAKAVSFYGVSPGWDPIVDQLLEEGFLERYDHAEEVLGDLQALKLKKKSYKTKKPAATSQQKPKNGKVPGKSRVPVLMLMLISLSGWAGWEFVYKPWKAESVAREQAEAYTAAQQQKIEALTRKAKEGLASGELDGVNLAITELKALGADVSTMEKAYRKMTDNAQAALTRKATAEVGLKKWEKESDVEGLEDALEQLQISFVRGKDFQAMKDWREAVEAFDEVLAGLSELEQIQEQRDRARVSRTKALYAKEDAAQVQAAQRAPETWQNAEAVSQEAQRAYQGKSYRESAEKWKEGLVLFETATNTSQKVLGWENSKTEWEKTLSELPDRERVEQSGGEAWKAMLLLAEEGSDSGNHPELGIEKYAAATVKLAEARENAFASGELTIHITPPDATLTLNGKQRLSGMSMSVPSLLPQEIKVEAKGYEAKVVDLTLKPGEKSEKTLELRPLQVSPTLAKAIAAYSGMNAKLDHNAANRLFFQAAGAGDPLSRMWLARCYFHGHSNFEKDAAKGQVLAKGLSEYLIPAAKGGSVEAMFLLGSAYASGLGVQKSQTLAVQWYREAAERENVQALNNLGNLLEGKERIRAIQKAAELGFYMGQRNLGVIYNLGEEVPKNNQEAVKWYRKAAEQGDVYAQFNLGLQYANGEGVPKNDELAVDWYRKAAEQGHANAQFNLGVRYDYGRGVLENDKLAVEWYRKAAEQGHARAQNNLGAMYKGGEGVAQSIMKAKYWYQKAAAQGNEDAKRNLRNL